jgi:hypothetical protein
VHLWFFGPHISASTLLCYTANTVRSLTPVPPALSPLSSPFTGRARNYSPELLLHFPTPLPSDFTMAPVSANTAAASQRQARRSVARIIPAIPHRFSRPSAPARPITPDESTTAAATKAEPEPQPAAAKEPEERAATPVHTPLTPDSNAVNGGHVDESRLAASPARSADDHVEEAQAVPVDGQGLSRPHSELERKWLTLLQAGAGAPELQPTLDEKPASEPQAELELETPTVNGDVPKLTAPAVLPPEFYPREKPVSYTPNSDGIDGPFVAPTATFPTHRMQPSVEGVVFGGALQDSPAVPSTPQESELDPRAQQQTFARPPPGFAPHLAHQFFPGHTHHPSDPAAAPWLYPTYTMAPPPENMYNGHDYHSTSLPAVAPVYHPPYQTGVPPAMNGATTSHTQSPSKSQFGEDLQNIPYANGTASRVQQSAPMEYDIVKHLSGLFGSPEFTDYVLHIRSPETMLLTLPVHAALVSRSPVILQALRRSGAQGHRSKDSRQLAEIFTHDRFVSSESLHEALKILYGAPLVSIQSFSLGLGPYDGGSDQGYTFNEARKRMGQAISYAAAGGVLQLPEMQACGMQMAKTLLRWDTLDQALQFGLEAGDGALSLLDDSLDFMAYNFPMDFSLYALAPEMRHYPRLPTVEVKQPTHNPRLSKIRFGDAPPEDELLPSHIAQVLSTVLLSLPLPLLDRLFSHPAAANQVGWSGLGKVMGDVVDERERRRQKASKGQLRPSPDGTVPKRLLENLQREERVEAAPERPSGYRLTASRSTGSV